MCVCRTLLPPFTNKEQLASKLRRGVGMGVWGGTQKADPFTETLLLEVKTGPCGSF